MKRETSATRYLLKQTYSTTYEVVLPLSPPKSKLDLIKFLKQSLVMRNIRAILGWQDCQELSGGRILGRWGTGSPRNLCLSGQLHWHNQSNISILELWSPLKAWVVNCTVVFIIPSFMAGTCAYVPGATCDLWEAGWAKRTLSSKIKGSVLWLNITASDHRGVDQEKEASSNCCCTSPLLQAPSPPTEVIASTFCPHSSFSFPLLGTRC